MRRPPAPRPDLRDPRGQPHRVYVLRGCPHRHPRSGAQALHCTALRPEEDAAVDHVRSGAAALRPLSMTFQSLEALVRHR